MCIYIYIFVIFIKILKILKAYIYKTWQLTEIHGTNKHFHGGWEFISVRIDISMKSSKCGIIFRSWASALSYRSSIHGEERKCSIILYLYHGSTVVP